MSDEEPQQTEWETEVGLSEETTYVAIYPSRKHAEEWMEEAEEQGYGSRSKYLYELIQEARAARQEGFLAYSQNESPYAGHGAVGPRRRRVKHRWRLNTVRRNTTTHGWPRTPRPRC